MGTGMSVNEREKMIQGFFEQYVIIDELRGLHDLFTSSSSPRPSVGIPAATAATRPCATLRAYRVRYDVRDAQIWVKSTHTT